MRGVSRDREGKLFVLAVLCAILFLFGTTVQQTHFHPDGFAHADCTICHTAPHVVQPSTSCSIGQALVPSTRVVLSSEPIFRGNFFSCSHSNRPPPDPTAIA
jgi:hypothetical protein